MLTVPMAAALQGFPPPWQFAGGRTSACRQVGNAFAPPVPMSSARRSGRPWRAAQRFADRSPDGLDVPMFREPVPDLTSFVTHELFLGQPRLSSAQFEVVRAAGHVLGQDAYHQAARIAGSRQAARYWREMAEMEPVTRLTLECGQGSGKDFMIAVSFAWIGFQLLHLRSPAGYYGLARTSRIHLLNVAASEVQAARSFFCQMSGALRASPWFTAWFASRPQHERAGIGATLVRFGAGIEAISGHSGIGKLEGLNLLAIAGDEVDEFES